MEIKTEFNLGDKVCIVGSPYTYEIIGIYTRTVSKFEVRVDYKVSRPDTCGFVAVIADEAELKLVPIVVTNAECTYTLVSTLKDVYGVDSLTIPDGYRFKRFAKPKRGDIMISADRVNVNADFKVDCAHWDYQTPRIILEKI